VFLGLGVLLGHQRFKAAEVERQREKMGELQASLRTAEDQAPSGSTVVLGVRLKRKQPKLSVMRGSSGG
jgi:hypothetical protein